MFLSDGISICGAWQQISSRSQHLNAEGIAYIPVCEPLTCFSKRSRSLSPVYSEDCCPPLLVRRSSENVAVHPLSRTRGPVQGHGSPGATVTSMKSHGRFIKALCGCVGPACAQTWEIFPGCNDRKHRQVVSPPSVQCQSEPLVPDGVSGTKNPFPESTY